jgi:F0F1-type ATP synthase assembly protein I
MFGQNAPFRLRKISQARKFPSGMTDELRGAPKAKPPSSSPGGKAAGVSGAEFAGMGMQFAATILVFVFAGVWLDKKLGTSPWLVIACVFAGGALGFYSMYRKATDAQRRGGTGQGRL